MTDRFDQLHAQIRLAAGSVSDDVRIEVNEYFQADHQAWLETRDDS